MFFNPRTKNVRTTPDKTTLKPRKRRDEVKKLAKNSPRIKTIVKNGGDLRKPTTVFDMFPRFN
jgi:hypothetical protein